MMKDLMEMMKKKKMEQSEDIPESKLKAKMDVVQKLKEMMSNPMTEDLKKVTVASDSEEGLKKGLEKAQDVVEKMPEMEHEMESSEEEKDDLDECSAEELDQMIKMLQDKKMQKMKG